MQMKYQRQEKKLKVNETIGQDIDIAAQAEKF